MCSISVNASVCCVQSMNFTASSRHDGAVLECTVSMSEPRYRKTDSTTLRVFSQ